jgi:hypothetical protein
MASLVTTQKLGSSLSVYSHDHDPGATTAILASPDGGTTIRYVDMGAYENLMVVAKPNIVGGGGLTKLELVASATVAFSTVVSVKDSGTIAADALQDNAVLECTAQEVAELGQTLRYVAARLTMATATDEATVTYIAANGREYGNQTTTTIT